MFLPIYYLFFKLLIAVSLLFLIPRGFDRLSGKSFNDEILEKILLSPKATALYAGGRLLAIAVLLSGVLGL